MKGMKLQVQVPEEFGKEIIKSAETAKMSKSEFCYYLLRQGLKEWVKLDDSTRTAFLYF